MLFVKTDDLIDLAMFIRLQYRKNPELWQVSGKIKNNLLLIN